MIRVYRGLPFEYVWAKYHTWSIKKKKVVLIMFFIRKKSIDQINANRVSFNLLNKQNVNKLLSVKEKGKKNPCILQVSS